MIPVARKRGASRIICVEPSAERLENTKRLGADVLVNPMKDDVVAAVMDATEGLGADAVFTANPIPATQEQAIHLAKNRARVNFFGGLPSGKSNVTLDTNLIHYKELFIHGTHGSMPYHHKQAVDLIRSGTIDVTPFISHKFPLSRILEGFEAARSQAGMRVVIHPWEE